MSCFICVGYCLNKFSMLTSEKVCDNCCLQLIYIVSFWRFNGSHLDPWFINGLRDGGKYEIEYSALH